MNSRHKKVFFGKYFFVIFEEVYIPAEDTFLLARNLSVNKGERVLDMGTGCGVLAVLVTEKTSKVVAVDVNPYAVACAKKNAELNGVTAKVEVRLGDLFDTFEDDEKFDLILFNAPYLPIERGEGKSWIEKAWAGGKTGRAVIDRFIDEVSKYIMMNGRILLVQSSLSNVEKTLGRFSQRKLCATIVDEEKLDFEKIVLIKARKQLF
ncbi:MAG: HemK2/MTQ2 family protein methyltransferase [Candidatus Bathyarchaeia archaeon]